MQMLKVFLLLQLLSPPCLVNFYKNPRQVLSTSAALRISCQSPWSCSCPQRFIRSFGSGCQLPVVSLPSQSMALDECKLDECSCCILLLLSGGRTGGGKAAKCLPEFSFQEGTRWPIIESKWKMSFLCLLTRQSAGKFFLMVNI